MKQEVCRVAISGATYAFDKLYDYDIPPELTGAVVPGVRVLIPFGRGDRTREAIVVRMGCGTGVRRTRAVSGGAFVFHAVLHVL